MVHGTGDYNAPISESEGLVTALMAHDREFEYMAYPGQPHEWISADVERDFARRVEAFLGRHMEARMR